MNDGYVFPGYGNIADALASNLPILQGDGREVHRIYLGQPALDAVVAALRFCDLADAPAPNDMKA